MIFKEARAIYAIQNTQNIKIWVVGTKQSSAIDYSYPTSFYIQTLAVKLCWILTIPHALILIMIYTFQDSSWQLGSCSYTSETFVISLTSRYAN